MGSFSGRPVPAKVVQEEKGIQVVQVPPADGPAQPDAGALHNGPRVDDLYNLARFKTGFH
jgi:hypothetical protein